MARFVLHVASMRTFLLLSVTLTTACAARAPRPTVPVEYSCGETALRRDVGGLHTSDDALRPASLGWRDGDGDHYVTWPTSTTDVEAVEYVVPSDPRQDAMEQVYDTSKGPSIADWLVVRREVCPAHDGYSDVLARYVRGESLDKLAHELALSDRDAARDLVHRAMLALQRRYYKDR